MTFYIGNSIKEIDEQEINVEFSDELIDFVYKVSKQESLDMSKLYEIDPYADVVISENDLYYIIKICNYILDESLLRTYEDPDEGKRMLKDLIEIAKKAQSKGLMLVSKGD